MPAGQLVSPATAWPSFTFADGHLRTDRNRGSARPARRPGQPDDGVEKQDTAGLSAPYAGRRCADCKYIPRRHQHAPGPPSTRGAVRRCGRQGHGEPGVAEGEGRLGGLERRSLAEEPIVRLILDGTVVRVRLDRKATSISLLIVIGVREDGQKVLLALKNMGGETTEAGRAVLDDLVNRGLRRPAFLIVDGATGLEKGIAAVWDGGPVQKIGRTAGRDRR